MKYAHTFYWPDGSNKVVELDDEWKRGDPLPEGCEGASDMCPPQFHPNVPKVERDRVVAALAAAARTLAIATEAAAEPPHFIVDVPVVHAETSTVENSAIEPLPPPAEHSKPRRHWRK